ncbi:MAG TPA: DoxX family protein [Opitutus sp.]|nr:DoxX family protein [Opitutus sp.]
MNLASSLNSLESFSAKVGGWCQSPLLFLIRLWWGWSFIQTGWGKLSHLDRVTQFFASLGLPLPQANAVFVGCTECVGGALLLLGLFARFVSPVLIGLLFVAYWTADREALFSIITHTDKFTAADPFLFLYAALIVFAFGPGKISLDALMRKKP